MPDKNDECDTVAHERELREGWQISHERVHRLEAEARALAAVDVDRRLVAMNEFRAENLEDRGKYLTREIFDSKNDALDVRLKAIENARSNLEGRLWVIGAVVVIINIAIWFFGHRA